MPNVDPTLYAIKHQNGMFMRIIAGLVTWVQRHQDASLYSSMTEAILRASEVNLGGLNYEVVPV